MDLFLVLKKQWFDMIESGYKKEEYRDIKEFWIKRLLIDVEVKYPMSFDQLSFCISNNNNDAIFSFEDFKTVTFQHGYKKNARRMKFNISHIHVGIGNTEWGAILNKSYFVISLGERIN